MFAKFYCFVYFPKNPHLSLNFFYSLFPVLLPLNLTLLYCKILPKKSKNRPNKKSCGNQNRQKTQTGLKKKQWRESSSSPPGQSRTRSQSCSRVMHTSVLGGGEIRKNGKN